MVAIIKRYIYGGITWFIQLLFKTCFLHEEPANTEMSNILVIRLDEIGDVVLMSPFLRELRRNYPKATITLIVKTETYNLVELCPYVNKVLTFPKQKGKWRFFKIIFETFRFTCYNLRKTFFDLAIVPRWDADEGYGAGWIALFSGAARRIGYSEHVYKKKEILDYCFNRFYTEVIDRREFKHEVERNLDVLRYLSCHIETADLEVWTDLNDKEYAVQWFNACLPDRKKKIVIALFLSAGSKLKEWSVSNFATVLKNLSQKYPLHVVMLGDRANTEQYGECFLQEFGADAVSNLIGKTSLRETIEILKGCDLYFGGDTGPMHLAAACNIDGVVLFFLPKGIYKTIDGISPPERFGPWNSKLLVLQPAEPEGDESEWDFERSMPSISLDAVQTSLEEICECKLKGC